MLWHEFIEMPAKSVGETPLLTSMEQRCKWCMKSLEKARQDGCPIHEMEVKGSIILYEFNPEGLVRFQNRLCLTCEREIMKHWLRKGSSLYWCYANQNMFSEGIDKCVYDVKDVVIPVEPSK
jgi:hypothetical protein